MEDVLMSEDEVSAQIAHVDDMIERCDAVARRAIPIRPDMSLPRHVPVATKPVTHFVARPVKTTKAHDYPHIYGGYGDEVDAGFAEVDRAERAFRHYQRHRDCNAITMSDVDRAFEACSRAPY